MGSVLRGFSGITFAAERGNRDLSYNNESDYIGIAIDDS